jgi:5-methylcytosine-specific restriction enzyme A
MPYLPRPKRNRPAQQGRRYQDSRYNGRTWRAARTAFLKSNPLCEVCNRAAEVVDHSVPVRIDPSLFYEPQNWQSLCHSCHNRKSATLDKAITAVPTSLLSYKAYVQAELLRWYAEK